MKMKYILIMLLFTMGKLALSQEFEGGIIAGFSGTAIYADGYKGLDKPGLFLGGYSALKVNEQSSFQIELNFAQKGSKHFPDSAAMIPFDTTYLCRLNYVEMPFLYKYAINNKVTAEAGLSYGVLISSYEEVNGVEVIYPDWKFRRSDFSGIIGIYYHWTDRIGFNFRFSHSIIPIRPHVSGTTYRLNRGQYNEVVSVSMRYIL